MKLKIIVILYIITTYSLTSRGQDAYLQNPSLEGVWSSAPFLENSEPTPEFWYSCQSWADPDEAEEDIPDGTKGGRFRTRGIDYDDGGGHAPSTTEYMINELKQPLVVGACYQFTIYLRHNPDITSNTNMGDTYSYPVKIELRGTNEPCVQTMEEIEELELLGSTEYAVEEQNFTRYDFPFYIEDNDYTYLMVRAAWDSSVFTVAYNGIIEFDNMSMQLLEIADPPTVDTAYYKKNPPFQLNAADGYSWDWDLPMNLSNPNIQNPYLLNYDPKDTVYTVTIKNRAGCPVYQKFVISYLCDTVYEAEFLRTVDRYYNTSEEITLRPSDGISYSWDQNIPGLDNYHIREPIVKNYFDSITVDIVDNSKYACEFKEKFRMFLDCDSLFETKDMYFYDTIEHDTKVLLDPGTGEIVGQWEPTKWLDDPYSLVTSAHPLSKITYHVNYKKSFMDLISCDYEATFEYYVIKYFPNVITPGNDRVNDVFQVAGLNPESSIVIFDKTGNIVFEANKYSENNWWNGYSSKTNKPVPSGTYWYAIEEPDAYGNITVFKDYLLVVW